MLYYDILFPTEELMITIFFYITAMKLAVTDNNLGVGWM
jgi:hypothetical protein